MMLGRGNLAEVSTAKILQEHLTERGLVRILASQDVAPQIVRYMSAEEAARQLQRELRRPPPMVKKAKKAKKSAKKGSYKRVKAKKASAHSASGRAVVRQVQPNYWARVKRELHILICTNDTKYQSIRRLLGKESRLTQTAIVSSIGGAIGAYIGAAATIVGPFVTLGLLALLQVGKEALCSGEF
jgi:hypothetical protein